MRLKAENPASDTDCAVITAACRTSCTARIDGVSKSNFMIINDMLPDWRG